MYSKWFYFCMFLFIFFFYQIIYLWPLMRLFVQNTQYLQILWICECTYSEIIAKIIALSIYALMYVYWGKKLTAQKFSNCLRHSYLTWYMSLPKIIKLSQTVWELWLANDFGIMVIKYILDKVRVLLNTTFLYWSCSMPLSNIIKTFQTIMTHTRIRLRNSFRGGN